MNATAKDLRIHSKQLLKTVSRGEEVIITFHGKPCAKLVPVREKTGKPGANKSTAFGMWKDHPGTAEVESFVRGLRQGRA
jgi:prevent-host-death family protein